MLELEALPRRKSLPRRVARWVATLIVLLIVYRVAAVYVVRPGTCAPPASPGRALVESVRDGRPAEFPPRSGEAEISVMSYNIQGHATLIHPNHLDRIAEVIRDADADVIGLQEVHDATWQSRFNDQLEELARQTGRQAAFGKSFDAYSGSYGNAILARGKIVGTRVHPLPGKGEPRSLLEATVILDGMPVNIYVTHLANWGRLQRGSRSAQIACIAEIVRRSAHPFVLMGDFNTTAGNPEITPLTAGAAVRQAVSPSEVTHILTQQHIDYIFPDSGWRTISSEVLTTGPSDHWPLVARLASGGRKEGS